MTEIMLRLRESDMHSDSWEKTLAGIRVILLLLR